MVILEQYFIIHIFSVSLTQKLKYKKKKKKRKEKENKKKKKKKRESYHTFSDAKLCFVCKYQFSGVCGSKPFALA
jgi:hypothetical protein